MIWPAMLFNLCVGLLLAGYLLRGVRRFERRADKVLAKIDRWHAEQVAKIERAYGEERRKYDVARDEIKASLRAKVNRAIAEMTTGGTHPFSTLPESVSNDRKLQPAGRGATLFEAGPRETNSGRSRKANPHVRFAYMTTNLANLHAARELAAHSGWFVDMLPPDAPCPEPGAYTGIVVDFSASHSLNRRAHLNKLAGIAKAIPVVVISRAATYQEVAIMRAAGIRWYPTLASRVFDKLLDRPATEALPGTLIEPPLPPEGS